MFGAGGLAVNQHRDPCRPTGMRTCEGGLVDASVWSDRAGIDSSLLRR